MEKIITLFQRNYDGDRLVRNEVTPGAEWVLNGEGVATKKFDGTCCMVKDFKLYKRYDAKKGRTPPEGFIPAQDPDEKTGHWPGWLLVDKNNPSDKYHIEGLEKYLCTFWTINDGTYELIGPKINGNKEFINDTGEKLNHHLLVKHGSYIFENDSDPRDYESIKEFLRKENEIRYTEGIVWHHNDGRMVKIKYKDFFKEK